MAAKVSARERARWRRVERDQAHRVLTQLLSEDPLERIHTIWECADKVGRALVGRCLEISDAKVRKIIASHDFDSCPLCGPRNPNAPHRVYLFHFPQLAAFKVGVTYTTTDTRLNAHRRAGGQLIQIRELPTWRAALDLERQILTHTAHCRLTYGTTEFPHGGGTECWADDLAIDLNTFNPA